VKGFPVRFLAASGRTKEAMHEAKQIEFEGVRAKVFRPEYIIVIAAGVGRHKDLARIEQLMTQARINRTMLDDILQRYSLKLPKQSEMRHELAQLSFEEKIRKVSELIRLSHKVKSHQLPCSLRRTKAIEVFMSERKRARDV